jgi:hypothetical protein
LRSCRSWSEQQQQLDDQWLQIEEMQKQMDIRSVTTPHRRM